MKKAVFIILSPVLLIFLFLVVLSAIYSPAYVYRLLKMNVADVYDYWIFWFEQCHRFRSVSASDFGLISATKRF